MEGETANSSSQSRRYLLWLSVVLAFVLLIAAWSTLISIASKHKPKFISIESRSAGACAMPRMYGEMKYQHNAAWRQHYVTNDEGSVS